MRPLMVAGIGTGVGKTLTSAILATLLSAEYWKPIECGESDSLLMKSLIDQKVHPPSYSLKAPLSPHHAARLEEIEIHLPPPPLTQSPLVIEGVGGVLVPLSMHRLTLDLFQEWECDWVIVSRHYLGSINHTLLTVRALKERGVAIKGLIFNGEIQRESEEVILKMSDLPLIGRLLPEREITKEMIQRSAKRWALD